MRLKRWNVTRSRTSFFTRYCPAQLPWPIWRYFRSRSGGIALTRSGRIDALLGLLQHPRRDVRGQDANLGIESLGGLEGRDGHRVGLLPAGAAGAPEAQAGPAAQGLLAKQGRDDPGEGPEMAVLPEKARQVRREGIDHGDELVGPLAGLHIFKIIGERPEVPLADPLAQPRLDEFLLAVVQVDAAMAVHQLADLFEFDVAQFQHHATLRSSRGTLPGAPVPFLRNP